MEYKEMYLELNFDTDMSVVWYIPVHARKPPVKRGGMEKMSP